MREVGVRARDVSDQRTDGLREIWAFSHFPHGEKHSAFPGLSNRHKPAFCCYMPPMRSILFHSLLGLGLLTACGPVKPTVDAGPDTSCGLDCAAQQTFGLIQDRCFEYSTDPLNKQTPPELGVWVRKDLFKIEGEIQTIPVEYRKGGQIVQTDFFVFKNGDLTLMRRIAGTQSVTYRTGSAITGVKWLTQATAAGENFSTSTTAFLSRDDSSTPTTYRITTDVPTTAEKKTPLGTSDNAFKILFGESPDHGSDSRRIFAPGVGFTVISSPFNLLGGSPTPVYLQRIRDIGTADAGTESCSLGVP